MLFYSYPQLPFYLHQNSDQTRIEEKRETWRNPVFLRVVPAASSLGEHGTQATAATVAFRNSNQQRDLYWQGNPSPVHLTVSLLVRNYLGLG